MLKKRNLLFLSLLILIALLLSSCFLNPPVTEGILKGQVMVPEGSTQEKDSTGQALPDAILNIIDLSTGALIATTTTDATGYYQISVPPGGPYLLEAIKDGIRIQQITSQVEVGIEYDLGTADCTTTAVSLIAQAMLEAEDYPDNIADIDLSDIEADLDFDDVKDPVCAIIQAGQDPMTSTAILQAVEDFLHPPMPAPTPTPTYTVTFDSQGGSAVDLQKVKYGKKATEPTAPTWDGYAFGGWYKEAGCINTWDFDTDKVTSNVTLYAKWTSLPSIPKLISPADGSMLSYSPRELTLVWESSTGDGTITYVLEQEYFDTYADVWWNEVQLKDISETSYSYCFSSMNLGRWRVKAKSEYGESEWSEWFYFQFTL